ncbi:MAG: cbb3-type cytochrome c oxidase subunit I, partial [Xanthomonadales bacterium]|nr:cbb3-type cytochrome c oxidase subunit I [Xanthomonadales bacterium]
IAGLGFIVWGHHMFVSGMNPVLGMTFMVSTMMIALPSAVKVFNWLGTIWGGKIEFTTPMLFSLSFVSMFIIGGLSGIFMAATPVDIFIHDTYFIVAHFHYVLFGGTAMAVFGAIYFWYPKMFGRMMNEQLGKVHFFLTFIFLNGTFFTMHVLGAVGFPRRLADPYHYDTFQHLMPMNRFMTWCAIG